MSTAWWLLPWHRPQVFSNRHTHTHTRARTNWLGCKNTCNNTDISCHFSLLTWNIFIISKNYRSSSNVFIQGLSAFALVTSFKMWALFSGLNCQCWIKGRKTLTVYWTGHDGRKCTATLYSVLLFVCLSLSPSLCLWQCVFSGNIANPMTLDAESLAYTI